MLKDIESRTVLYLRDMQARTEFFQNNAIQFGQQNELFWREGIYMRTVIFLRNMKLLILHIKSEIGNWKFYFLWSYGVFTDVSEHF